MMAGDGGCASLAGRQMCRVGEHAAPQRGGIWRGAEYR
jgi:hypothetical protein